MEVRKVHRLTAAAGLGCLTLALVSACGTPSSGSADSSGPPEKPNLVVGAVASVGSTALYVAQERGIFAAHGLHVTIKTITSTSGIIPDLLDGRLDVATGQVTTFIAGQANGAGQFRVIASGLQIGQNTEQLVTLATSQFSSPTQLAGRVIAINAATGNGVLLTDDLLGVYNVAPAQVTYKVVPFQDMAAALSSHEVDAAYCSEPWCTEMEQQIGATELADLDQGAVQGWMISGYTVTSSWLKKYPRTAAAFAASIEEASNVADTDPAAVQQAFRASLDISQQVASVMSTGSFPTSVAQDELSQVADLMTQYGELSPNANVTAVVNALSAGP
jgi:NitT/TauT family transport system substrate-binding protein